MYNKLFTKILDSSIWLESTPTRIVWLTLLATMDEAGFVQFAAVGNVASRARVTMEEAAAAMATLEAPDRDSSNPEHEGRRVERVPGGWMVLNATKHRELVTRAISREQTRIRVQRHRDKKRAGNARETPSEAVSVSVSEAEVRRVKDTVPATRSRFAKPTLDEVESYCRERGSVVDPGAFVDHYESNGWRVGRNPMKDWKSAVRTWEKNDLGGRRTIPAPSASASPAAKRLKVNPADPRAEALVRNLALEKTL